MFDNHALGVFECRIIWIVLAKHIFADQIDAVKLMSHTDDCKIFAIDTSCILDALIDI